MNGLYLGLSGPESELDLEQICSILSQWDMQILDINQGTVYGRIGLGILTNLPDSVDLQQLKRELLSQLCLDTGQLQLLEISQQEHFEWLKQRGIPHFIVTVQGHGLSAEALSQFYRVIDNNQLTIASINRLSGYPVPGEKSLICLEFSLRGQVDEEIRLRHDLLSWGQRLDIDVGLQRDDMFRRNRRLVAFDMDATLIRCEVIDRLAALAGVGEEVAAITAAAMAGELPFSKSLRKRVALLKGLPVENVHALAQDLPLAKGAGKLIDTLKALRYRTAIISGGFDITTRALQHRLGMDYSYANSLDVRDGKLTGKVLTPLVTEKRKAVLLRRLARKEGLDMRQVIAVGDGANDLAMLSSAGLGVAFSNRPAVLRSAHHSLSRVGLDAILYLVGVHEPGSH